MTVQLIDNQPVRCRDCQFGEVAHTLHFTVVACHAGKLSGYEGFMFSKPFELGCDEGKRKETGSQ